MTSKKSFLVNIMANVRRRIWLIVVMFLFFFFSMPVLTAMTLSMEKMYMSSFRQVDIYLGQVFAKTMGMGYGKSIFVSLLAVLAAIQGFSYMYQRKKLDMYMSVPVTKGRRFAAIYLNGLLAYFLSYLFNMMLSFFVARAMGADISMAAGEAAGALLGNTILYLAVYHVAILAVMLTGNLIVTVMGTAVLLFYDGILYLLLIGYMSTFFHSFHGRTADQYARFVVSPVVRFERFLDIVFDGAAYDMNRVLHWNLFFQGIWPILLTAAAALGLAYWCYTKKPAEVCGKAMAFPKTKAVIKILVTIEAGLGGGLIFYSFSGRSLLFLIFGLLAGMLLCHGIMEVIYDFDIRSVRNGWRSLIVAGACLAVIFAVFQFDVFGYDSYIPDADAVEDIALKFQDSYDSCYDDDLDPVNPEDYVFDGMHITNVRPVLELAGAGMGNWERVKTEDDARDYRYVVVRYHLKNGKDVYRQFLVAYRECVSTLDTIVTDEAYQKGVYSIYNEPLMNMGDGLQIYYDNGSGSRVTPEFTVAQLQEAYRKDLKGFTYTIMMEELVQGKIDLEYTDGKTYLHTSMPVYPSFANTVALLKQAGYYTEDYLDIDEVEQIIVRNNNSSAYETYARQAGYDEDIRFSYSNFAVEAAFDDKKELEEIAGALYPDTFREYWTPDGIIDGEYYVTVIYTRKKENTESYSSSFYMLADRIPEFVKEQTTYQGDGQPTNSARINDAVQVPAYY